jgi:hypothetical protein
MKADTLIVERKDHLATVFFNRPGKHERPKHPDGKRPFAVFLQTWPPIGKSGR